MPSLRFRPEATEELAEAQRWYEQQGSGLGDDLVIISRAISGVHIR